jgi:Domain of unknown function (DUF4442)
MDVSAIPFNRFLGLRAGGAALMLPADPKYHNHLGTVHASAQFALAEAASGRWLLDHFGEAAADYVAVVRHADVKYRRPAAGGLAAHASAPPGEAERFLETVTRRGACCHRSARSGTRRGWERHAGIRLRVVRPAGSRLSWSRPSARVRLDSVIALALHRTDESTEEAIGDSRYWVPAFITQSKWVDGRRSSEGLHRHWTLRLRLEAGVSSGNG